MRRKRSAKLRQILNEHRQRLQGEVESRLRSVRGDHPDNGRDEVDVSDDATGRDLDQALLQMRAETLVRIDEAIARFEDGDYGRCVACDGEIAEPRLRALPFAVRCRACEQAREEDPERARPLTPRSGIVGDFPDNTQS